MALTQPITPAVLKWAIEQAGLRPRELNDKLDLPAGSVKSWLRGEALPNQGQLQRAARQLGRLPSFFFLPEPPPGSLSTSFRTFAGSNRSPGPETLEGIALATSAQRVARWIRQNDANGPVSIPRLNQTGEIESQAAGIREWLQWDTRFQTSRTVSESAVAKALRTSLQERGVLVLHLTLDEELTRGFSLDDALAPLIAINTRDQYKARLFSYVHELAHLGLGGGAVCDVHITSSGRERFCNQISAATLMPAEAFRSYAHQKFGREPISTLEEVGTLRNQFKVSLRAAALRAEELGLGVAGLYAQIDGLAEPVSRGGTYVPGQERTKSRIRVDQLGSSFVHLMGEAVESRRLSNVQAAEILRLSQREFATALQQSGQGDAA